MKMSKDEIIIILVLILLEAIGLEFVMYGSINYMFYGNLY